MELRTHARILKQAKWFIVLVTILCAAAAYFFAITQPTKYNTVVSFELQFVNRPAAENQYQYGSYYDLKGAELFTQHLMSLFSTPAVVAEVYDTAGQGYEIDNIGRFTGRFTAKQYSAQHFVILFDDHNPDTAKKLGNAVVSVVDKHVREAGSINQEAVFTVQGFDPVIAPAQVNPWLVTVIGLFGGALMSVILVYLREYFRE